MYKSPELVFVYAFHKYMRVDFLSTEYTDIFSNSGVSCLVLFFSSNVYNTC